MLPNISSTQTAIVVGRKDKPANEEIYADEFGRVKVRLFWDRRKQNAPLNQEDPKEQCPGDCPCWVRVAQPWTGNGWGHQWIPRIGQEVVVTFLEGDPDRRLITGCVYNGFAFTGAGTSVFSFGPSDELSINVNNIGQQITDYLDTHPKITDKTLFIVWGGANDILTATSEDDIIDAGINQTLNIQRLIDAGATQFIVPNLPPLGLVPRLNGSPTTSVPATEGTELYNEVLAGGIDLLRSLHRHEHLQLSELDVYALFNKIVAAPDEYSLANVTDSSQATAIDPDTYLFWDSLHPTTRGHDILAVAAAKVLERAECGSDSAERSVTNTHADCADEFTAGPVGARR